MIHAPYYSQIGYCPAENRAREHPPAGSRAA